jgi:predicted NAD-dependent protein-ADP-ribosyltransferase YbiA (DUF1768 family)
MELMTLTANEVTDDLNPESWRDTQFQPTIDNLLYHKEFLSNMLSNALQAGKTADYSVEGPFASPEDQVIAGANNWLDERNFISYEHLTALMEEVGAHDGVQWAWDQTGAPTQQLTDGFNPFGGSLLKQAASLNPVNMAFDIGKGAWDLSTGMWGEIYEDLGFGESDFSDYAGKAWGNLDNWWEQRAMGYAPNPYKHDNWFDEWVAVDDWQDALWMALDLFDIVTVAGARPLTASIKAALHRSAVKQGEYKLAYSLSERDFIKKDLADPVARGDDLVEEARPIALPDEAGVPVIKEGGQYGTTRPDIPFEDMPTSGGTIPIEAPNYKGDIGPKIEPEVPKTQVPKHGEPVYEMAPDIDLGNGIKTTHPITVTPTSSHPGLTRVELELTESVAELAGRTIGAERSFVLVQKADGTLEPWYRSTSQNSGKTEWFPFDGFGRPNQSGWIRKPETHLDAIEGGAGRPEGHQEISDLLAEKFDDVIPNTDAFTTEELNTLFGTLNIPEYLIAKADGLSMRRTDFVLPDEYAPQQGELFQFANEDEFLDAVEADIDAMEPGNRLNREMAERAEANRKAGREPNPRDYQTFEEYEDAMYDYAYQGENPEGVGFVDDLPPAPDQPVQPLTEQQELRIEQEIRRSEKVGDKPLKHFTTAEGRAGILATGHDPARPPLYGTGGKNVAAGTGKGKFAGNRLYLSLDDTRWGGPTTIPNDEVPTFVSRDEAPDWAVPVYDYEKQEWMFQVTGFDEVALESVEYTIKPTARKLVIDSGESYEAALREARSLGKNQNLWLNPEANDTLAKSGWDALSKKYDIIEIRNVDELADGRNALGRKFFQAAGGDQVIVLNQNAVELVTPKITNVHYGKGQNTVLSNFHEETFTFGGREYLTAEGAYQAHKTGKYVNGFQRLTGKQARDRARKMNLEPARGENKAVMRAIIKEKYKQLDSFRTALDETSGVITHDVGDSFWAETFPEILMDVRGTSQPVEAGTKKLVKEGPTGGVIRPPGQARMTDGRQIVEMDFDNVRSEWDKSTSFPDGPEPKPVMTGSKAQTEIMAELGVDYSFLLQNIRDGKLLIKLEDLTDFEQFQKLHLKHNTNKAKESRELGITTREPDPLQPKQPLRNEDGLAALVWEHERAHITLGHTHKSTGKVSVANEIEANALALRRLNIDPKFLNPNPKKVDIGFRQGKPKKIKNKNEAKKLEDQSARELGEGSPRGKMSPPMKNRAEYERWKARQQNRTEKIVDNKTTTEKIVDNKIPERDPITGKKIVEVKAKEPLRTDRQIRLANREEWEEAGGLTKIISGGQMGIDQAGLRAAKAVGLETGGLMPKGQLVYDPKTRGKRSDPEVATEFGLTEHTKTGWLPRTEQNVIDADGTLIYDPTAKPNPNPSQDNPQQLRDIEKKWGLKSGSMRTVGFAMDHNKPFLVNPTKDELIEWMKDNNIQTLNIAGPRFHKKGQSNIAKMFEEELIEILEELIEIIDTTTRDY